MKLTIGFILAFMIGAASQLFGIPLPAPPTLLGALLLLTVTSGYLVVDYYLTKTHSTEIEVNDA